MRSCRSAAGSVSASFGVPGVVSDPRLQLFNGAAEKIFGWPRARMLGQALDKLIPPRFRAGHAQHIERFGSTGVTSRRMGGLTVVYGIHADGHEFPLDASISQLDTAQGKLYTVILRDVTERVRAQEERSAFAAAAFGTILIGLSGAPRGAAPRHPPVRAALGATVRAATARQGPRHPAR